MKYVGSKARLSKDIAPIINKLIKENNIDKYIEPFVGGANMIDKIQCKTKIGYDNNRYLIAMWNKFKEGYNPPMNFTKEEYLDVKDNMDGKYEDYFIGLVGFCATYNAGWFRRWGGSAITKSGKVRDYYNEAVRNIIKQVPNILDVDFKYANSLDLSFKDCLIYCDAPYENSSYEMYKEKFDHNTFWDKVREWSKNNIVLVSEYNAPNDFVCIFEKKLTTTFDNKQRKKDTEKLFIHKNLVKFINK